MGKGKLEWKLAVAAAEAVAMCNIDVAAVYPITPKYSYRRTPFGDSSSTVTFGCGIHHRGIRAFRHVCRDGRASFATGCPGPLTATSSQGLSMYMHEVLPIAFCDAASL